jgi:myo-inositol-1(or 4)-monophosphatase
MLTHMALPTREVLEAVAVEAGRVALAHFRRVPAERKPDRTLVTAADREVEAFLAAALDAAMPGVGVLGEEGTARPGRGTLRAVVDPIDGTAAFVAGLPTWCVSIGILDADRPVAGIVHLPCTGETYVAVGDAAWWQGTSLPRLGNGAGPDGFLVTHSKSHLRHVLRYPGKVRSLGSAAYHVALVARGVADAAIVGRPYLWDVAGAGAVLHAVGGGFEYLGGGPVDLGALGRGARAADDVLAGTPARLRALRAALGRT